MRRQNILTPSPLQKWFIALVPARKMLTASSVRDVKMIEVVMRVTIDYILLPYKRKTFRTIHEE